MGVDTGGRLSRKVAQVVQGFSELRWTSIRQGTAAQAIMHAGICQMAAVLAA
jgi:hypothetical protein